MLAGIIFKRCNRIIFICFILIGFQTPNLLRGQSLERIEPPHWYTGMQNPHLQLMVYGNDIGLLIPEIKYDGLQITDVHTTENPNYLFIDLQLSKDIKPGSFDILLRGSKGAKVRHRYELKKRKKNAAARTTFSNKDVVYLITPDRFVNGDSSNDSIKGMKEGINRNDESGRHGGDLKGIIDNLDYIQDMGFTALWLNPVTESDQPKYSYHGYATTDYYKIDPRYGSNKDYVNLSKLAKEKGIGLIMDMIANHCSHEHWWMSDLPTNDWINYQNQKYQETNHSKYTLLDPHAAEIDREIMTHGWFVPRMPDLNQNNKFLATYLIQNSIWWIEYADLYGIRQDTYSYPFKQFMSDWTCAIDREYPGFKIVGEEWVNDPSVISYWQKGKMNPDGYTSCLQSVVDFPLSMALTQALTEEESWNSGLIKLYESLAQDYHYPDANNLLVMADNHDMSRIFQQLNQDIEYFKIALTYILTTRGIPQIYYGTEILMDHPASNSHGSIRSDFPGGWKKDSINAFTNKGLSDNQLEIKHWLKELLQWRKNNDVIHNGQLTHYAPKDGVYVYFRYDTEKILMFIINKNKQETELALSRFIKFVQPETSATNLFSKEKFKLDSRIRLSGKSITCLELDN